MSDKSRPVAGIAPDFLADLAAASRILADKGVVDGFGHVSVRHPHAADRYFMSRALAPALVTPADIVEYDLDSVACADGAPAGFIERYIHGEIYRSRPDIGAVVHSHSPSVIPFGLVDVPMQAMFHNAGFLAGGVPVFDIRKRFGATDMLVCDCEKGVALAQTLANNDVVLMRAHGSVACGPSLETAVFRAVYTEVNARIQHWTLALAGHRPIACLDSAEGDLADKTNRIAGQRAWHLWRSQVREQVGW